MSALISPLFVLRDPDRARAEATEVDVIAAGAQLPSGTIYIEWNREAFAEGERAEHPVTSRYETVADAEQATGGDLVFGNPEGEWE